MACKPSQEMGYTQQTIVIFAARIGFFAVRTGFDRSQADKRDMCWSPS